MTYEIETDFTITDVGVPIDRRAPRKFTVAILYDVDVDAELDEYGEWIDRSAPFITGYRVKIGTKWEDVRDDEALFALIELALVYDDDWMMDHAREVNA